MKKIIRISIKVLSIIIALLIFGLILLIAFFPTEKARLMAIEEGTQKLGREVNIETADISFWNGIGIKLGNVTIANPEGFESDNLIEADNVDLKLSMIPLIRGKIAVDKLIINRPKIDLVKNEDGSSNFAFPDLEEKIPDERIKDKSDEEKAVAAAISFDNLQINEGELNYNDKNSDLKVQAVGLSFSTNLTNPGDGTYESEGEIKIDSLLANKYDLPDLTVGINYYTRFDYRHQNLEIDDTEIELNGIKLSINGLMQQVLDNPQFSLNIQSDEVAFDKLMTLLDEEQKKSVEKFSFNGLLGIDLDLQYDPDKESSFKYYGLAQMEDVKVHYDQLQGDLTIETARVDFKNDDIKFNIENGFFDNRSITGILHLTDFDNPYVSGELAGSINLAYLTPFIKSETSYELNGIAEIDVKLNGLISDYKNFNFSGTLKAADGKFNSDMIHESIDNFSADIYFDNQLTLVNSFKAKSASGDLGFSGRFYNLVPYLLADSVQVKAIEPEFEGDLTGAMQLGYFKSFLPPKGNPSMDGQLDLSLKVFGDITKLRDIRARGEINILDASYSDSLLPEKIEHFSSRVMLSPDTIDIKSLKAGFETSDFELKGTLIDPFPYLLPIKDLDRSIYNKPELVFEIYSKRFDFDKLFPEAVPGSEEADDMTSIDSISFILLPDIDGYGRFQIDSMIYNKIGLSEVKGLAKMYDKKIDCYDITAKVYGGDVSGNTVIDLSDIEEPIYSGSFKAVKVEANNFVSRFSPIENTVYGTVNLEGKYNAKGWDSEQFLNSLTMNSSYVQSNGKIQLSDDFSSKLTNFSDKIGEKVGKEHDLKNLSTMITVKDGKIGFEDLKTKFGELGDLELSGFFNTSGDIDYSGSILLSEKYTKSLMSTIGDQIPFLSGSSVKRVKLPLAIKGTKDKPSIEIDYSAVKESAGDSVKDKAEDFLKGLFK